MAKFSYAKGSTSVILHVFIMDSSSTTGAGLGSLTSASSIVGGYVRAGGTGVALAVDEAVSTPGTYQAPSTAAHVRIGTPANMRTGTYELHFHNDLFASGADSLTITLGGAVNMADLPLEIQLTDFDLNSANNNQTGDSYAIVNHASYGNAQLVRSTTPANTLDVNATGEAGIDLDNTSGTLAKGTEITGFNDLSAAQVNAECDTALTDYDPPTYTELLNLIRVISRGDAAIATDLASVITAINTDLGSGAGGFANTTEALQSIRDRGDSAWITATGFSTFDPSTTPVELLATGGTAGVNAEELVDLTWDEVLTGGTHNVANSSGKRIRDLQEFGTYEGGHVFIDTINGLAGTTDYENGTNLNPSSSIADANTIATSLLLTRFAVAPRSSITFAASQVGQVFDGADYIIALGGQDISNTQIAGAYISGTATAPTGEPVFKDCVFNSSTLPVSTLSDCTMEGTMTLGSAGEYHFHDTHCGNLSTGCVIDFGIAIGDNSLAMHNWSGIVDFQNMGALGVDYVGIGGHGIITINANCAGGTIHIHGDFEVTDSSGGAVTVIYDDNTTNITSTLTQIGTAGAGLTDLGGMSTAMKAEVLAETVKLLTTQMTESYAANGIEPTLAESMYAIHQMLMQFAISGTSYTVKKLDNSTTAFVVTLDDATTPTGATRV